MHPELYLEKSESGLKLVLQSKESYVSKPITDKVAKQLISILSDWVGGKNEVKNQLGFDL